MGDSSSIYTLDEALNTIGFGNYHTLLFAYGGLGWMAEATEMMILSFIGSAVQSEWGLSSSEKRFISTVVFAGMLFGAYSMGYVSDTYGRKKGILGVAGISAVARLLSAFSPNYISLIVTRCLVGFGIGGGYIYTSWFLEFVPTPKRGAWMVAFTSFWTLGTILKVALAWIIMPSFGWRWLVAISSIPSFVVLLFYGLLPESPRFLCMKGKTDEARLILEKAASLNGTILQKGTLVYDQLEDQEIPGMVLSAFIVDRIGRKFSMATLFVLGFIILLPLLIHQNEILTTASLFGARTFLSATLTIACIYAPEVYPTNVRATGVGVAGKICPLVAAGLVNVCHQTCAVILFEIMILLCGLSVLFVPFESKGKSLPHNA